jgi:hypothetical protein
MWKDKEGKRRKRVAYADKRDSLALAWRLEDEANPEAAKARKILFEAGELLSMGRRRQVNPIGFIYFIGSSRSQAIKIGFSAKYPTARLETLQISSPHKLKLLAVIRGNMRREKKLHEMFAESRLEGEWFKSTPELRRFINDCRLNSAALTLVI